MVSVVIPTCQRDQMLSRCLKSVIRQKFNASDFEVIVVDDGVAGATKSLVEYLATHSKPVIRYFRTSGRQGPAAARNIGWKNASGKIIAFIDDDCIADKHWLRNGVRQLNGGKDAVVGRLIVPVGTPPSDYEWCVSWMEQAEFMTANLFCRKSALEKIGGFDERFEKAWREDSDIQFRMTAVGMSLSRSNEAVITHPVRPARWGISLFEQKKSQYNALLYKKFPEQYRKSIEPSPPWLYYTAVGAAAVALAGLALSQPIPAAIGGGIWMGCVLNFTAHRLKHTSRAAGHVWEMVITSALIPFLSVFWRIYGALKYRVIYF